MPKNYKATGIVIKRMNYKEADKILTIFTREQGKISAIAKGVRRSKSKLTGYLEPFTPVQLELYEGRGLDIVVSAELASNPTVEPGNLNNFSLASCMAELIGVTCNEGEQHTEVYDLFATSLQLIGQVPSALLMSTFELKLLNSLGFTPELNSCTVCHQKLLPGSSYYFCPQHGGIVCAACIKPHEFSIQLTEKNIKLMRFLIDNSIKVLPKLLATSSAEIKDLVNPIESFAAYVLEHDFKTKKFLQKCAFTA